MSSGAMPGLSAILSVLVALVACGDSRFPTCKTNADCAGRDAGGEGSVCYNLKCVQCHYDSDCKSGACSVSNECEQLVRVKPVPERPASSVDPKGWEYGSWDQCAADCQDKQCLRICDQKFNK